jgi:hypothetical protein
MPPVAPLDRTCFRRIASSTGDGLWRDVAIVRWSGEIANTPGTFFFCCLLYADDSDFPAAVELGVLRVGGLQVQRFRNRFDL